MASDPPGIADQFESHIVWMSDDEMLPGRRYLVKLGATTVGATIDHPKHGVNVNTLEHVAAKTLTLNEIGVCNVYLDRPVPYDRYVDNRDMGGFIVIDRMDNTTVGAGLLHFALRRADNVHWQAVEINQNARAAPRVTGLRLCGSPVFRAPASRRSPTYSSASSTLPVATPICSMVTTSATAQPRSRVHHC